MIIRISNTFAVILNLNLKRLMHQVLNIRPGVDIDVAAALAIKAASVSLRGAEAAAFEADPGHGLPKLEKIMGGEGDGAGTHSESEPEGDINPSWEEFFPDDCFDDPFIPNGGGKHEYSPEYVMLNEDNIRAY